MLAPSSPDTKEAEAAVSSEEESEGMTKNSEWDDDDAMSSKYEDTIMVRAVSGLFVFASVMTLVISFMYSVST